MSLPRGSEITRQMPQGPVGTEDQRRPDSVDAKACVGPAQTRLGPAHRPPDRSRPSLIFRTTAPGRWDPPTGAHLP